MRSLDSKHWQARCHSWWSFCLQRLLLFAVFVLARCEASETSKRQVSFEHRAVRAAVEGWGHYPTLHHSYAVVQRGLLDALTGDPRKWRQTLSGSNEFSRPAEQVLCMSCDFHSLEVVSVVAAPLYNPKWLTAEEVEAAHVLASRSAKTDVDITLRFAFPFDITPASVERHHHTFVFATTEFGNVSIPYMILPGQDLKKISESVTIVTPSEWSRAGFLNAGVPADRVVVLHHGVDEAIFDLVEGHSRNELRRRYFLKNGNSNMQGKGDNLTIFATVGAMTENKGIEDILSAFVTIHQKDPSTRLLLKGHDSLYSSHNIVSRLLNRVEYAAELYRTGVIQYEGRGLGRGDLIRLLCSVDIYVSPYRAEGFNMPAQEAAACGLVVIASSLSMNNAHVDAPNEVYSGVAPTDEFCHQLFCVPIRTRVVPVLFLGNQLGYQMMPEPGAVLEAMQRAVRKDAQGRLSMLSKARLVGPSWQGRSHTWHDVANTFLGQIVNDRVVSRPRLRIVEKKEDIVVLLGEGPYSVGVSRDSFLSSQFEFPRAEKIEVVLNEACSSRLKTSRGNLLAWVCAQVSPLGLEQLDLIEDTKYEKSLLANDTLYDTVQQFETNSHCVRIESSGKSKNSPLQTLSIPHGALLVPGTYVRSAALKLLSLPEGSQPPVLTSVSTVGTEIHVMSHPVKVQNKESRGDTQSDSEAVPDDLFALAEAQLEAGCLECARLILSVLISGEVDSISLGRENLILRMATLVPPMMPSTSRHLQKRRRSLISWLRRFLKSGYNTTRVNPMADVLQTHRGSFNDQRRLSRPGRNSTFDESNSYLKNALVNVYPVLPNIFLPYQGFSHEHHGSHMAAAAMIWKSMQMPRKGDHFRFGCGDEKKSAEGLFHIGVISANVYAHSVGKVLLGLLLGLGDLARSTEAASQVNLKVTLFVPFNVAMLQAHEDPIFKHIVDISSGVTVVSVCPDSMPGTRENSIRGTMLCSTIEDIEHAGDVVLEAGCDAIIFGDVGTEPVTYAMAVQQRYAPVQVAFWGNPISTGIPWAFDFFVTGEAHHHHRHGSVAVNKNHLKIQSQFVEQVVRLDGFASYYYRPQFPTTDGRPEADSVSRFGPAVQNVLKSLISSESPAKESPLLLSVQALLKASPDFDEIVRRLLISMPDARLILLAGHGPVWASQLHRRLKMLAVRSGDVDTSRNMGLERGEEGQVNETLSPVSSWTERVHIIQRLPAVEYAALIMRADVVLDSFPYSGFTTSIEALALGAPVVTLDKGETLRGSQTGSLYRSMGHELIEKACVAHDKESFHDLVFQLATDKAYRKRVRLALTEVASKKLFQREDTLRTWISFLYRAVRATRQECELQKESGTET